MRCKDFHEIADSYLSDELLVETNHEVFRHLEECEKCREELKFRTDLRARLRAAAVNAPDAQIDPSFAARLRFDLRKDAFRESAWTKFLSGAFSVKTLAATTAVLLIAVFAGFASFSNFVPSPENASQTEPNIAAASENIDFHKDARSMWREISMQAVGDHKHCAMENLEYWQKAAVQESPQKALFKENYLSRASDEFPEKIELQHVHDCIYDGRKFTHAVLKVRGRTVSVLLTESEIAHGSNNNTAPDSTIICRKQTGFQVASFAGASKAVFVISDMTEAENLNLARSLSNVMQS